MFKNNNQAGFSMIEVMIVLAITATVMTGVLVAAQALQRAGRNHQRSADVSFVLATVNEYQANTGKTPTDIGPLISKFKEGLQYYHPTPGAISPDRVISSTRPGTNYLDLEIPDLIKPQQGSATERYFGRIWKFNRSINGLELKSLGTGGHLYGNTNTSCSISRVKTIGFPDCKEIYQGASVYKTDDFATEIIGIFSNAECLNRNNITYGSHKKQIAVMYKLEGSDSAQCADI